MSKFRRQYANPIIINHIETRNLLEIKNKVGNIYEAIAILSQRANQINSQIKGELHLTISDFSNLQDNTNEEFYENREQIEISKAYEKIPNPAIISLSELYSDKLYYHYNDFTE